MNPRLLDPLEQPAAWDAAVRDLEGYTVFHSAAWARTIAETYRYRPIYALDREGEHAVAFACMDVRSCITGRRGVGVPFSDFAPPLGKDAGDVSGLMLEMARRGRALGWRSLEWRGGASVMEGQRAFQSYLGHVLSLDRSEEDLQAGLKNSIRRNIRKADREQVEVAVRTDMEAVAAFCRLNDRTRRSHGLPPQPFSFFRNLHRYVIDPEDGCVVLASRRGKTLAANVYLHAGRTAVYKYGASDAAFQHLRGSDRVMWEAVRWYAARGFRELHFGRTDPGNQGLRRFKQGWGVEEYPIHYYRYRLDSDAFVESNGAPKESWPFMKRLPLSVLRLMGRLLYRHMG